MTGTMEFYEVPETVGNGIIPTDELIFFRRGRYTTNQISYQTWLGNPIEMGIEWGMIYLYNIISLCIILPFEMVHWLNKTIPACARRGPIPDSRVVVGRTVISQRSSVIRLGDLHLRGFVVVTPKFHFMLVGGFKHFLFSIIYGIILPID